MPRDMEKRRANWRNAASSPKGRASNWRYRQSEKGRATQRAIRQRTRARNKALVDRIKLARGCIDCGFKGDDPGLLHFDHLGDKKRSISSMLSCSWLAVEREIQKCVVRCFVCHFKKTRDPAHYRRNRTEPPPAPIQECLF